MSNNSATNLSDDQFFFAYLSEYQDGSLSESDKARFDSVMGTNGNEQRLVDYGLARGQLQLEFQKVFVDDELTHQLHVLLEDDAARANHEASDIEEFARVSVAARLIRGGLIALAVIGLGIGGYYWLGPKSKPKFSALDSLVYESAVMIEDPEGRLDFPTNELDELRDYFARYPNLGFSAKPIKSPESDWQVEGAAVIDYEVQKIAVAQFGSLAQKDKLFIYQFEGRLEDFPYSQPGNYQGLLYQTYASDYFNVLVWELEDNVIGMIVGSRKAEELAQAAFKAVGL